MFSAVLALAILGTTLILAQVQSEKARKDDRGELVPARVRVERPRVERRRLR